MRLLLPLISALLSISAALGDDKVEYRLEAYGEIEIAPDGSVRDYRLNSDLIPMIRNVVDQRVRRWRFQPIIIDGKPVVASTRMNVSLKLLRAGENFQLFVEDVSFGGPERRINDETGPVRIRYPSYALERRVGARVMLALKIDAEGRVVTVHPYQTSINGYGQSERGAEGLRRVFERASVKAVSNWKFDMEGQLADGSGAGTVTYMMRVVFQLANHTSPQALANHWQGYAPGPVSPVPWLDAAEIGEHGLLALGDGQTLALNPRFRLIDDPVGKAL